MTVDRGSLLMVAYARHAVPSRKYSKASDNGQLRVLVPVPTRLYDVAGEANMSARKLYREVDSLESIIRPPSANAQERADFLHEAKAGGCELCGSKSRTAFYHRDPSTKKFDVQSAGLGTPQSVLEAEIEKCVLLCVSCRMKIRGWRRPSAAIHNKKFYWELQRVYSDLDRRR